MEDDVFIVHGRDHKPMKELKAMLQEFGLNPIVLHEQASGARTIVEKLEKYSDVGYTFVILTPEDVGCLNVGLSKTLKSVVGTLQNLIEAHTVIKRKGTLKKARDELSRVVSFLKPRPRQNVVLEFGYFMGLLGRDRVCCLYKGDVELPSDMHGIVYIPFKESVNECLDKIIKELKAAGYKIKNNREKVVALKSSKRNMKCPVENCEGTYSSIRILTAHLAMTEDSGHKAWKLENGLLQKPKTKDEMKREIKKILESRMWYNPTTKLYEFC